MEAPSPGSPEGTRATDVASTMDGFSLPSSKPVRSRSWWYCHPTISCASVARPMSSATINREVSNTTSYEAPANQTTTSCCVAGNSWAATPRIGSSNPTTPTGAASGATTAHSSGRKPATRLTPPIVVRGSRRRATLTTTSSASADGEQVELEIGMSRGAECEDAGLR